MKDDQSNSRDADINSKENGLNLQGFEKKKVLLLVNVKDLKTEICTVCCKRNYLCTAHFHGFSSQKKDS